MKAILLLTFLLVCPPAFSEEVYLYVMFHDDNSQGERFRTKMQDMAQCLAVIDKTKMPMPERPAGDYEVMGAMWCGGAMQRHYGSAWWADPAKVSSGD